MNANFLADIFFQSYYGIFFLSTFCIFLTGKISYLTAYAFQYHHWHWLIFPSQKTLYSKIGFLLRVLPDKLPFVTFLILTTEKFNLSLIFSAAFILFFGLFRLGSTQNWFHISKNISKWRFEIGVAKTSSKILLQNSKSYYKSKIEKLTKENLNNKFQISKADFRCYVAFSLLLLNLHFIKEGLPTWHIDLIALVLIIWCTMDALYWNFKLNQNTNSAFETYQESLLLFLKKFFLRHFFLGCILLLFFLSFKYLGEEFSRYNLTSFILFFMFLTKFLRIWNEASNAKSNLPKQYYPEIKSKNHKLKFENAKIWRDIGAERSKSVHPLVKLVMLRTVFELSDRSFFIGIITHLDLIAACLIYTFLIFQL